MSQIWDQELGQTKFVLLFVKLNVHFALHLIWCDAVISDI